MQDIVPNLIKWLETKTLPPDSSLYLIGSCADQSLIPGDMDLIWISHDPFPERWIKELFFNFGLPLDLCVVPRTEFIEAAVYPFHPLSYISLAVKFQGHHIGGASIIPQLANPGHEYIKQVRQIQGLKEWMNFKEHNQNKVLQKVILSIALYEGLIPIEAGKTKMAMHESLISQKNGLAEIYQTLLKGDDIDPESLSEIKKRLLKMNDLSWVKGQTIKGSWQRWDIQGRLQALLPADFQEKWSRGELFSLEELIPLNEIV